MEASAETSRRRLARFGVLAIGAAAVFSAIVMNFTLSDDDPQIPERLFPTGAEKRQEWFTDDQGALQR